MHWIATRLIILLALCGCWLVPAGIAPAAERLDIRATSVLPREVQAVLNDLGAPTPRTVLANQRVEIAMRQHCGGSYTDAYRDQFVALNTSPGQVVLQPSPTRRVMYFPPCPRIKVQARVHVFPGDTVNALLMREMGVDESELIITCEGEAAGAACRAVTARAAAETKIGWAAKAPDPLAGRKVVVLPFASKWTTIVLKDGVAADQAIKSLGDVTAAQLSGRALLKLAPSPELSLPHALSSDLPDCTLDDEQAATWPFDRDQVRAAMLAASTYLSGAGFTATPTVVRIADTGATGVNRADGFPESVIAVNKNETFGASRDNDKPGNGYYGDRYGIAPNGSGAIEPLQDMDTWLHGSQVAQLALGGADFRGMVSPAELPVRLNFARLWQRVAPNSSIVDVATISHSFLARPRLAAIVNLSVGGPNQVQPLLETLLQLNAQRQIAVIAAGNDGNALGQSPLFPASYGAKPELQPSVIVVGAHGPNGRIASFSNRGRDAVHLLAPGCALADPYDPDGERLVGTSFAAPLVTFVVAAIRSYLSAVAQEQMGVNPIEVKMRLRATTRYVGNDELAQTRFGGVLDIPAALRVFDDVIRLPDGNLVVGRWIEPRVLELCEDTVLSPDSILRIRVEPTAGAASPRLHVISLNSGGLMAEAEDPPCDALSDGGIKMILEDGQQRSFRWREIAAFVPAVNLSMRRIPLPEAQEASSPQPVAGEAQRALVDVQRVQEALDRSGFSPGPVDGIRGPATVEAIRKFQASRGEQPSGTLNELQGKALLSTPR